MDPEENKNVADAIVPEDVAAQASVEPESTAPVPKYSDNFRERIKKNYPDEQFADDEVIYQKAIEQLDNLEQYQNSSMESNKALLEIFDAEPGVLALLKDMVKGLSFPVALARNFDPADLVPQPGEPSENDYKEGLASRANKVKELQDWNSTRDANMQLTQQSVDDFVKETGIPEDQATEILTKIGETLDEVYSGKVTKSFLMSMYRALNFDKEIADAEDRGVIRGRNEKIEVKKEGTRKGDGLPDIKTGGSPPAPGSPRKASWVDTAYENEKKKQIL